MKTEFPKWSPISYSVSAKIPIEKKKSGGMQKNLFTHVSLRRTIASENDSFSSVDEKYLRQEEKEMRTGKYANGPPFFSFSAMVFWFFFFFP